MMREHKIPLKEYETLFPPVWSWGEDQMTKKEAKEHFDWFVSIIPERIALLENVIRANPPSVDFKADFSRESLIALATWLKENVTYTTKTSAEMRIESEELGKAMSDVIRNKYKIDTPPVVGVGPVDKYRLSLESESLSADAGIYYCETVRKLSNGKYEWGYPKTRPKSFGFQQPAVLDAEMNVASSSHAGHGFMIKCVRIYGEEMELVDMFAKCESEIEKRIQLGIDRY